MLCRFRPACCAGVSHLMSMVNAGKISWVEFAHHTTWDEFKESTTRTQFFTHAHLARDQYVIDTLFNQGPRPLTSHCHCEKVFGACARAPRRT